MASWSRVDNSWLHNHVHSTALPSFLTILLLLVVFRGKFLIHMLIVPILQHFVELLRHMCYSMLQYHHNEPVMPCTVLHCRVLPSTIAYLLWKFHRDSCNCGPFILLSYKEYYKQDDWKKHYLVGIRRAELIRRWVKNVASAPRLMRILNIFSQI